MKVTDHLKKATKPLVSFEIIPPARGNTGQYILNIVDQLKEYNPAFIDVTSHSAEASYEEQKDGTIKRKVRRKRPGTIGICGVIQNRFNIDTVAHILCTGFTREETEDALIELNYLGIENVFALRGDETNIKKSYSADKHVNKYSSELVAQIADLRQGIYLDEILNSQALDFCIGVAGYPEKHFEAPNLKTDVRFLKNKLDAGADFITTQMFFENKQYFNYLEILKQENISTPVIPGLKIINNVRQISSIPKNFYVDMPEILVDEIMSKPEHVREIGIEWTINQCRELLANNAPVLHFYIMNDTKAIKKVLKQIGI